MRQEAKQALRELIVALTIVFIFFFLASLSASIHSKVNIFKAFEVTVTQILVAGSGGVLGNIFYVLIIFLTLGITFYTFEKVIILLSEIRIGGILMKASLSSIKDHYIVCGGGRVGSHAAEKLKKANKKIVIIESDCKKVEQFKNKGFIVIEGDCMSEETLERAKIRKAKGLLACTGDDHKNVFLVLTSKDLNPKIKVATRVNDQRAKGEFERAGADIIVAPEITGGYELAEKIIK
jgi:voltage-gated potassium channel